VQIEPSFEDFAPQSVKLGAWRPLSELQKPATGGLSTIVGSQFSSGRTAWLAMQC
jgi:hypothetical protein